MNSTTDIHSFPPTHSLPIHPPAYDSLQGTRLPDSKSVVTAGTEVQRTIDHGEPSSPSSSGPLLRITETHVTRTLTLYPLPPNMYGPERHHNTSPGAQSIASDTQVNLKSLGSPKINKALPRLPGPTPNPTYTGAANSSRISLPDHVSNYTKPEATLDPEEQGRRTGDQLTLPQIRHPPSPTPLPISPTLPFPRSSSSTEPPTENVSRAVHGIKAILTVEFVSMERSHQPMGVVLLLPILSLLLPNPELSNSPTAISIVLLI